MILYTTEGKCEQCGTTFRAHSTTQRFCNMDCVTQFKLDNYKRFCQLCGTEVSNKKKFCPVCVEIIGLTSKLRFEVFKRDKFTCKYCGRVIKDGIKLEVDHIIPVSKGGKSNMDNLVTACKDCNRGKSDNLLNEICKK